MELTCDARSLYKRLQDLPPDADARPTLMGWLDEGLEAYRAFLKSVATAPAYPVSVWYPSASWELYALSRVNDVLLGQVWPRGQVPVHTYLEFVGALGMRTVASTCFDPFLYEISEVIQADDPAEPVSVVGLHSPAVMVGDLLFSRARVTVRAGSDHAVVGWADTSALYWTYCRQGRPTEGWGSNSQWQTRFRRDYRTPEADLLNVEGSDYVINSDCEPLLSLDERIDLLRHRCFVRPPAHADELCADDLRPYDWYLVDRRT
ncbi:MAG: hypothetical protein FWF02_09495 [Micrococcales bacterium]|nr:hypothetical protein [Micrococcales bacterium]MCL2667923.1 hypothetical protein [Micrococcales bacterium]